MKHLAYTDATFAPNESIKCKTPVLIAQIDNDIYKPQSTKAKVSFVQTYIAKPWGLNLGNKHHQQVAKRILMRSVMCN